MALTDSQIQDRIYGEIVAGGMSIGDTDYSFSSIEAVKSWVAKNGEIPQEAYINFRSSTYTEVQLLYKSLNKPNDPPKLAETKTVNGKVVETNTPKVLNEKDKPSNGDPTITILSSGNAANTATGLRKSNDTRNHICNMPMFIQQAISKAGFFGGQLVMGIRKAIKALLTALGINPSGSSIVSYLKKIAREIKDALKFLKDIQKGIQAFVTLVGKIRELIAYILSLPQKLIAFFNDCLKQAYKYLKAGYLDAIQAATGTSNADNLVSTARDLVKSTNSLITEAQKTATMATVALSGTSSILSGVISGKVTPTSKDLDQLTAEVKQSFSDMGYSGNSKENYGKA